MLGRRRFEYCGDWGFEGLMMSDWGGTYDGLAAVNAGQGLQLPGPAHMNRKNLLPAIEQGKVPVASIDEHVRRILRTAARFGRPLLRTDRAARAGDGRTVNTCLRRGRGAY